MKVNSNFVYKSDGKEDFSSQYTSASLVNKYLLNNYYRDVDKLLQEVKKINNALEIGCGEGYSTMFLRKLLDSRIKLSASEIIEWQVDVARKNNNGLDIFRDDICNMRCHNNSFDLLFVLEVLEHIEDIDKALKELSRVSKKYILIGVPNEPLWRILNFMRGAYISTLGNTPGHINHWSSKTMRLLLEKYGFRVLKIKKPLPWLLFWLKNNTSRVWGLC